MGALGGFNARWAGLIVEELVRCGIVSFVYSPGFRSAPLTLAARENPQARCTVHYDERGGAFFALGIGRITQRPAVWITTSGTAAANGLPAVVEAAMDHVPLICLTADRPPELRETNANQTINQVKLFGSYPDWFVDLPPPSGLLDPSFLLTTVGHAVHRARGGPVHLNCMFREPLVDEPLKEAALPPHLQHWLGSGKPYTTYASPGLAVPDLRSVTEQAAALGPGIMIAGRMSQPEEGRAVLRLARKINWPLLGDIGAQLPGEANGVVVPHYELLLKNNAFATEHRPRAVLHVGGPILSKPLQQFLAECRPELYVLATPKSERIDPTHQVTYRLVVGIEAFCESFGQSWPVKRSASAWTSEWCNAGRRIDRVLAGALETQKGNLDEPYVIRAVSRLTPPGHTLTVANSMPIRDMQMFGRRLRDIEVVSNRGASGIDGTVATAAGVAAGSAVPGIALLGDLALLHDLNSLVLAREHGLTLIVLNNNGGGIFNFMPIDRPRAVFEKVFGTPHGLEFGSVAKMYGLRYEKPSSRAAFDSAYEDALKGKDATLIEVVTDREENVAVHQALYQMAQHAVNET